MATEFHTFDAQGGDITLPRGAPFTTWWVVTDGLQQASQVNHPWNALDVYGPADLARFRITAVTVPDPPAPLPAEVPMYRVKIVLAQQGLTAGVTAYLASLPEPQKTIATTLWSDAPNLVVQGDFALQVKAAMGFSDDQYRALILAAVGLAL